MRLTQFKSDVSRPRISHKPVAKLRYTLVVKGKTFLDTYRKERLNDLFFQSQQFTTTSVKREQLSNEKNTKFTASENIVIKVKRICFRSINDSTANYNSFVVKASIVAINGWRIYQKQIFNLNVSQFSL